MDETQFTSLLGRAALKVWPELPREAQEQLFSASVDEALIANSLAEFLHDRHTRTSPLQSLRTLPSQPADAAVKTPMNRKLHGRQ